MKKLFLYIPAMLLIAVSCEKEAINPSDNGNEPASGVKMITEIVSGSRGDATKATIGNTTPSFAWTVGDNVAAHVSNEDSHEYVITSKGADAAASSAKFEVTYGEGYSRDAFAVYPSTIVSASAANFGQSGHSLDVTLPGSYTLAQVSGETSPCPMISANEAGSGWHFYQLCGLLRLTVNSIPATAKRLEIDFNGKKVCGDFSIASPVVASTAVISTAADGSHDTITITKDGTDVALGETSLTINIPLPAGTYNIISVIAYDEISGGNALYAGFVPFARTVDHTNATKKAATLGPLQGTFSFTFKDKDTGNNLGGLRFVRLFSSQNKLYNGKTTFGPYTDSSATGEDDMANPIEATLKFAPDADDQLAFQVVDASGKVYSGLYDVFAKGYSSSMTVDVKAYTFTVASGKKVYFSPGDLGVDSGVYSFTEPFADWAQGNTSNTAPSKRVWFDMYIDSSLGTNTVYGIEWRNPIKTNNTYYEWNYIVADRSMDSDAARYYKVSIPGHQYCLLLPPDETVLTSADKNELEGGSIGDDYAKYLGKGFVLLYNTGTALYGTSGPWKWNSKYATTTFSANQGYYWAQFTSANRIYFTWPDSGPSVDLTSSRMRNHIRYIRNVTP